MISKERSQSENLPTPTLLVTDLGILAIAPELRKNADELFKAVRLGMDLDDFWDFGVTPRPLDVTVESKAANNAGAEDFYNRYAHSFGSFIEKAKDRPNKIETERLSNNAGWFVSSIHYLEGSAITRPQEYWNAETVQEYRESVALVWAMFMASLVRDSQVDLYGVANSKGHISLSDSFAWMNDEEDPLIEKTYTRRMFYGALVFQVVSDYGKREFARENFIPSFGGIGFEEFSEQELKQYIELMKNHYLDGAKNCGVDPVSLKIFLNVFPKIQKVLNSLKKSPSLSHWAYS